MLELAVELGSSDLVQLLLDARATVNPEVSMVPPLMIAVLHRHRGNVQLLLNAPADPWQTVPIVSLCDHPGIGLASCRELNLSTSCKYPLHRARRIRWLTYSPKAEMLWIIREQNGLETHGPTLLP